jgi:hypothetical protein
MLTQGSAVKTARMSERFAMLCPYCGLREANTKDHVFPEFLGGHQTIPACRTCNNDVFGGGFESLSSQYLKIWMLALRRSGMPTPRPMVWRGVRLDDSGRLYDLDHDLKACYSFTKDFDNAGKPVQLFGHPDQLAKIVDDFQKGGREWRIVVETSEIDLRSFRINHPIDDNLRRLCVKMSIAAAFRLGVAIPPNRTITAYLIKGSVPPGDGPVRITIRKYEELDMQRPKVGHLVYVRTNSAERRAYSIVQFFGLLQFYCELDNDWTGEDHAVLATHDPVTHEDNFKLIDPLDFAIPEQHLDKDVYNRGLEALMEGQRLELVALYGDQAPLTMTRNE